MKPTSELLKTEDYWLVEMQSKLFDEIEKYREAQGITRTELANRFGVTKGYISQLMNGNLDHRISKIIKVALAIGKAPVLEFEDLEKHIEEYISGETLLDKEVRLIKNLQLPAMSIATIQFERDDFKSRKNQNSHYHYSDTMEIKMIKNF